MNSDFFLASGVAVVFLVLVLRATLRSRLWLSRTAWVRNVERRFGSGDSYIRVTVMHHGRPVRLLLTNHEFRVASDRADKQVEEFTNDNS